MGEGFKPVFQIAITKETDVGGQAIEIKYRNWRSFTFLFCFMYLVYYVLSLTNPFFLLNQILYAKFIPCIILDKELSSVVSRTRWMVTH